MNNVKRSNSVSSFRGSKLKGMIVPKHGDTMQLAFIFKFITKNYCIAFIKTVNKFDHWSL